ncbi:hypothetical protein ACFY1S_06450 [Micromonospora sp. NPDC000663]|uniref:hypothetical protein n=1 Tax=Micromonospora sp. NPDC000663 TaxID=3364218 RepID=UPI0036B72472
MRIPITTPISVWAVRRTRWPIAATIVPTAADGAKTGAGMPNTSCPMNQDNAAASAACTEITRMTCVRRSRTRHSRRPL